MTKSAQQTPIHKKPYLAPRIEPQGQVEAITLEQNKVLGPSDGYLFQGMPIQNAS